MIGFLKSKGNLNPQHKELTIKQGEKIKGQLQPKCNKHQITKKRNHINKGRGNKRTNTSVRTINAKVINSPSQRKIPLRFKQIKKKHMLNSKSKIENKNPENNTRQ